MLIKMTLNLNGERWGWRQGFKSLLCWTFFFFMIAWKSQTTESLRNEPLSRLHKFFLIVRFFEITQGGFMPTQTKLIFQGFVVWSWHWGHRSLGRTMPRRMKTNEIIFTDESESIHSMSLEDLKINDKSICCCGIDSRNINPTIKRDRQLQLFKVNTKLCVVTVAGIFVRFFCRHFWIIPKTGN